MCSRPVRMRPQTQHYEKGVKTKVQKPNLVRVDKAPSTRCGGDNYLYMLVVLSLLENKFMEPRLKETFSNVSLPVTKTPCNLSPVTCLQRAVKDSLAIFCPGFPINAPRSHHWIKNCMRVCLCTIFRYNNVYSYIINIRNKVLQAYLLHFFFNKLSSYAHPQHIEC